MQRLRLGNGSTTSGRLQGHCAFVFSTAGTWPPASPPGLWEGHFLPRAALGPFFS